jgi:hypothetical protein
MLHVAQYVLCTFLSGILLKFERLKVVTVRSIVFGDEKAAASKRNISCLYTFSTMHRSEEKDTRCPDFPTEKYVFRKFMQKICSILRGTIFVAPSCIFKVYRSLDSHVCLFLWPFRHASLPWFLWKQVHYNHGVSLFSWRKGCRSRLGLMSCMYEEN